MSASDQMRQMLDQLMGTARNGEKTGTPYDDPKVCKAFLLDCCPHDILSATRMDMGECSRVHDLALRADFEAAQEKKDHFFDVDACDYLLQFVNDIDKKVEAEQEYRNSMPASTYQQQKLRVCEVCSAYLGIHDNDRRLADHFGGKLHLGFIKIREDLAKLEATMEVRRALKREAKMLEIANGGGAAVKKEEKSGFGRRDVEDRRRDRDRDRRRSRSRSRDRRRDRDRSRDRHRRHRRSRSRSRDRHRHKHRRSRSRDRRRSRSRSGSRRVKKERVGRESGDSE